MSGRMCQGGMPKAAGCISAAAARVPSFRKQRDDSTSAFGRQSSAHSSSRQLSFSQWRCLQCPREGATPINTLRLLIHSSSRSRP